MEQILEPKNPGKLYTFYKDDDYNVLVKFNWNSKKDTITEGIFHIIESEFEHELKATNICGPEERKKFSNRLELHLPYLSKKPVFKTKKLKINLKLSKNDKVRFAAIIYKKGEKYDPSKYHCDSYSIGIPDIVKGGVVIKP